MPSTNTFNKASWVAMKGLSLLKNSLSIGKYFSDEYAGEYAKTYAIGKTLTVPLSQRYTGQRNDMSYNPEALDRPVTTITVDQTDTISLQWDDIEKALDMERGEERVTEIYLKPVPAAGGQPLGQDGRADVLQPDARPLEAVPHRLHPEVGQLRLVCEQLALPAHRRHMDSRGHRHRRRAVGIDTERRLHDQRHVQRGR